MRVEKDALGSVEIEDAVLYGIHTKRAMENFPFGGERTPDCFLKALAEVKKAALEVNLKLGYIDTHYGDALIGACDELIEGAHGESFPLPFVQGGAGTSTNMNMNEVIANRALQIAGEEPGAYGMIHPIETVNLHQSTNDVYPTALKMTVIRLLRLLSDTVASVQGAFQKREHEFAHIITMGRTELQDAVPLTLGGQFGSFSQAFERDRWRCFKAEERIRMVNIGGTAIGTGLTAPRDYILQVIEKLRMNTGLPIGRAEFLLDATANLDCFVEVSAILLANAVNLIKVSRDLRFLHYQQEIKLKPLQAGSSIMPGKVNPVALEAVISLALKVKANNNLIAEAVELGSLQINEYLPLIASTILESLRLLEEANGTLCKVVQTLEPGVEACRLHEEDSLVLITAFLPHIGYKSAEELLNRYKESERRGTFRAFLVDELGEELVTKVLKPLSLMALGYKKRK